MEWICSVHFCFPVICVQKLSTKDTGKLNTPVGAFLECIWQLLNFCLSVRLVTSCYYVLDYLFEIYRVLVDCFLACPCLLVWDRKSNKTKQTNKKQVTKSPPRSFMPKNLNHSEMCNIVILMIHLFLTFQSLWDWTNCVKFRRLI